ncbi:MAG TPA: adenylate/guanylate cyclase domain-containing protein [Usitatibacteraceae bacterium]|nr:adenylate/guanylate cyclase domain-containing protein [Usitatibacteraceae bacterium]
MPQPGQSAPSRPSWVRVLASFSRRAWAQPRSRGVVLYLLVVLLLLMASRLPDLEGAPLARLERAAFDSQMRILRDHWPQPIASDVVLIGIDEGSEEVFTEPVALWHKHFARLLSALTIAGPRAVGVDVVPPERSYDDIAPGYDLALFRAIRDIRQKTVLVFALTVDREGRAARMHPTFARVIGEEGLGLDQQWRDPDSVLRRFSERELGKSQEAQTIAGQMLRGMGMPVGAGFIDYSIGSRAKYIPMQDVIAWKEAGDIARLQSEFNGRVVLVGYVLKRADRWELPVQLIDVDLEDADGRARLSQPGVITHLQVLRSHLASGLLHPVGDGIRWAACLLAAGIVFVRVRFAISLAAVVVLTAATLGTGLFAIRAHQLLVPVASIILTLWTGFATRGIVNGIENTVERGRLRRTFAGQVSPAVMNEMLAGSLTPGVSGQLADVCILFSDIRDFTTLSERMPPVVVTTVLQRYFDRMVRAVHRHEGTVDKFIGDGMMVLFGAPRKSADPCGDAVKCALAMMTELDELNTEFETEGLPTLTNGIGINFGVVTVGNIGSSERHNYSAIGDAVNVAARMEGLTKELGRKILITEAVVSRIGENFHFDPLGTHQVKGHSPVNIWGIRTARPAPAAT